MDRQLTYDMVRDHLMHQNCDSLLRGAFVRTCAYRGTRKMMCAVGCLIPDELMPLVDEGKPLRFLPDKVKAAIGIKNVEDETFLGNLQSIHDQVDVKEWAQSLYDFALNYELRP